MGMATTSPTGAVAEAVLRFLEVAGRVYEAAVAIHAGHTVADGDPDISRLSATLAAVVEGLRAALDPRNDGDGLGRLAQSCVKLGSDLLVRLGRVQELRSSPNGVFDPHAAWPAAAVGALASRIQAIDRELYEST